ncbi:MAG: hypothetical protein GY714_07855 [Desulfobacterales bacterium]|nr:hypothetical protein [Desulfobacterales bacterium]MCP4158664.1 hypothetical protein [Deltaproteobacteria bacterium]
MVKNYIMGTKNKDIKCVEYRTRSEGYCTLYFYIIPKIEVKTALEALISLANYALHFFEEWDLEETTEDYLENIINRWILPEYSRYIYTEIDSERVLNEINGIYKGAKEYIIKEKDSEKNKKDSYPMGVFVNSKSVEANYKAPISNIISGLGLELEWNSIEIFYETEKEYVLFSWGTGA